MSLKPLLPIAVLAVLTCSSGCFGGFFSEEGALRSEGPGHESWQWHPQGCTRDPFDGKPVGESKSIVTLLWANPGLRISHFNAYGRGPDAPLRLEIMPDVKGQSGDVVATLHTVHNAGILLDKSRCTQLDLKTQEHASVHPGGRPSMSGRLELDCRAASSHLTANIRFEHCEY